MKQLKRFEVFQKPLRGIENGEKGPVPQIAVQTVHRQSANTGEGWRNLRFWMLMSERFKAERFKADKLRGLLFQLLLYTLRYLLNYNFYDYKVL